MTDPVAQYALVDASMLAARLYGKEDVRVEQVPQPPVQPGEVRLRIGAALTCGTDLKVYRRGYHARMITLPFLFGHEFAGEIESVGAPAESAPGGRLPWKVGMRVVAANSAPCDACFYCERGMYAQCEDLLFVNGAYAEYLTLPERVVRKNLLPIPDHLSYEEAAMVEPLACVVRGMEDTQVQPNETVAVIGAGQIGLLFMRLCKLAGARVIAVGRRPDRLEIAREMGADVLLRSGQESDIVESVRRHANGGRGPDKVIECVGLPDVWERAIEMGRKGAVINLFGGCPKDTFARLDTHRLHYDELTIKGTFHHTPSTVRQALHLISEGLVPVKTLIQQRASLQELPGVFKSLTNGNTAVKVAIYPHG
jgi:L-iditol 2-dehydrogenase